MMYAFDGERLRGIDVPAGRPLRWAAWRADGSAALLVGNRGEALLYAGELSTRLATNSGHNLRGAAWSPDGREALLVGNRGAVLRYDGRTFVELAAATSENLRRVAWHPTGAYAVVAGNAGVVLRYDAGNRTLMALPGDRAHTMRSIAWRADGAYALIGAYASPYAGYPRPHALYRCDGRYTQAWLATDDNDDVVAVDWRPGQHAPEALCVVTAFDDDRVTNKLFLYNGSGFRTSTIESPQALLGGAWHPSGDYALLCGERGALLRHDGDRAAVLPAGTEDHLVGPFWRPDGSAALLLKGPQEKTYTT
jgi:hypothetical protein